MLSAAIDQVKREGGDVKTAGITLGMLDTRDMVYTLRDIVTSPNAPYVAEAAKEVITRMDAALIVD
jgi:hypothetical protein